MEKIKNFVKEHKMLVAISVLVVVIAIVIAILLLSGNDDKLPTSGSDVTVGNTTESTVDSETEDDYLSGIGTAPDDSSSKNDEDDKDNADEFPDGDDSETTVNPDEDDKEEDDSTTPVDPDDGDKDSEDDSTEPTEPDDGDDKDSEDDTTPVNPDDDEPEEPVHTCNYNTLKNDSSNHWYVCSCGKTANKSAHNYSDEADTTCNTCGYTRTVVTPEPEKPSTIPSVSWTGGDITLGSLGISIPTLKDFNDEALTDNTNNTFWTGDSSDTETIGTLYTTLDSVAYKLVDVNALDSKNGQGFAVNL